MGSVQPPTAALSRPGVLTKTIIRTPVVKFILHARIRHWHLNDVVFVGEDFIHIKQVKHNGHLEHIATKDNFDSRIKAAKTFSLDHDAPGDGDDFIKIEQPDSQSTNGNLHLPPQVVVLTLDSDDLVFLYLKGHGNGLVEFVHQTCPMLSFKHEIHKTGFHLAVDPASRALAVAASEREVIIYSAKPTDLIQRELEANHPNWCPISSQRSLAVTGVIQHMEFLHPHDTDPDHIILLLILVDQRRTKALRIDWHGTSDLRHAHVHPPQPMEAAKTASSLLVPLRDAAFLIVTGSEMVLHRDILSGSMRSLPFDPDVDETRSPGSSSRRPVWTSWCRPLRNKSIKHGQDIVYLIREDGTVILFEITDIDAIHASNAGNVGCHVGSAFASLGDPSDPDILAVVGDMSSGRVVHMGNWPSPGRIRDMSRVDTMEMQESETLPNWASSVAMVLSTFPQSQSRSSRTRDAVVVTSGREPYGSITELRTGLEARAAWCFDLEVLKSATGAWVLPNISTGSIMMLLSTPSSTSLYDFAPDMEGLDELDEHDTTVMALDQRTLTAGFFDNGHLVQICERSMNTSANLSANFEDRSKWEVSEGESIIAGTIEASLNCTVVVRRSKGRFELLTFKHYAPTAGLNDEAEGLQTLATPLVLDQEPLCLATTVFQDQILGVFATVDGTLQLFAFSGAARSKVTLMDSLQISEDEEGVCDHLVFLQPTSTSPLPSEDFLVVCGLRDGRMLSVEVAAKGDIFAFGQSHSTQFGHETVRLFQQSKEIDKAYAFCGLDTCVLTWDGTTPQSLDVENLWVSDKSRPHLSQGPVTMVSKMPTSDCLSGTELVGSLAGCLVVISSHEVSITTVDNKQTVVPRQIQVTGTPTRVIYAEQQRSFVCASVCTGVRSFPSNNRGAPPEERRQIWPVIEFIPAKRDGVSFTYDLQPGERVFALLEWSFQQKGKPYSLIIVGGSYFRPGSTQPKGRIAFLQVTVRNWEVEDVKEGRATSFNDPVYALALYDELTYIACVGPFVRASRFDQDERKWEDICAPFKLAARGVSISVSGTLIHISTAKEGLVTLRLEHRPSRDEDGDYPYRLVGVARPPRADDPSDHIIVSLATDTNIAVVSTKEGQLLGLTTPPPDSPGPHRTSLLFEAHLPRSLISIRQGSTRPLWRASPPAGVLNADFVGLAIDGSMTGVGIIDEALWRRLFWLQRVLEWDDTFSPHAPEIPAYGVEADDSYSSTERALPIGFTPGSTDEIALFSNLDVSLQADRHVDGDLLGRVLEPGGRETLVAALRRLAQRDDSIGEWVEEHLGTELSMVDGIIDEIRGLLGMWM